MMSTCCSPLSPLAGNDAKALSAWRKFERAFDLGHTCLPMLDEKQIEAFREWANRRWKPWYAGMLTKCLRTAARRQGADIPLTTQMRLDIGDLAGVDIIGSLTHREKTACRHFVRFLDQIGRSMKLADVNHHTYQEFRNFLVNEGRLAKESCDFVMSHFRKAVTKAGGSVPRSRPRSQRSNVTLLWVEPFITPYLSYLKERWKASTYEAYRAQYRRICTEYLEIVSRQLGVPELKPEHLVAPAALDAWISETVSCDQRNTYARAVKGLLSFWGTHIRLRELKAAIRKIESDLQGIASGRTCQPLCTVEADSRLSRLAEEYVEALRLRGFERLSEASWHVCRRFLRWCHHHTPQITGPECITVETIDDYLSDLVTKYTESANTLQHYMSLTGGFLKWLHHRRYLPAFRKGMIPKGKVRIHPRYLTQEQVRSLLRAVKEQPSEFQRLRDLAIIVLALTTGPRGVELQNLTLSDVNIDHQWVQYRCKKSVRIVPLPDAAAWCLEDYLRVRGKAIANLDNVFLGGNGAFASPLHRKGIGEIFNHYRDKAGISAKIGGIHVLRHTFAIGLADDNVHPLRIKELLGHQSLAVTNLYVYGSPSSVDYLTSLADDRELEARLHVRDSA